MKIVITGATSGIGRQLALDYHAAGEDVLALGRNEMALAELRERGLGVASVDLTDREGVLACFSALDSIDLAVLCAGTCEYIDLPDFDSALVQRVMRSNVESVAISLEAVLPLLRKSSRGHLAVVSSSAAYLPLPRAEAYGASKAAVSYMIESLRIDMHRENIAVSLISPGFVKTPLTDRNDFPMPCLVSVEQASTWIRKGLARRSSEIHFPKRFTFFLKLLALLPNALWRRIGNRLVR